MKRLLSVAVLLAFWSGIASTQVRFGGGAHGGLSLAAFGSAVSDFYGLGFGGGVHGDVRIIEPLTIRVNADYYSFPSNKDKLKGQFTVTDPNGNPAEFQVLGANRSIVTIGANAVGKIPTRSTITPYGLIGFGLNIGSASDLEIESGGQTIFKQTAPSSDTRFGLNFGAGSEFGIGSSSRLFFEVKYVVIFAPEQSIGYVPFTFGMTF